MDKSPLVGVIMGSDSDLPVMKDACEVLEELEIPYKERIISAHRTAARVEAYVLEAQRIGIKIIIAGAGGAAHLPGMAAAHGYLSVIGVPIESKTLKGMDSLLSIVQMPPGIPVATMSIGGAKNAGIMAAKMLAISDDALRERVIAYQKALEDSVIKKDADLVRMGYREYLKGMAKK